MTRQSNGGFREFYRHVYWEEHKVRINIAFHMAGTIAGILLLMASFTIISVWWALAFPIVHIAPGLIGHFLSERSEAVGNARVFRTDVPGWWFVVANHLMTARMLWRASRCAGCDRSACAEIIGFAQFDPRPAQHRVGSRTVKMDVCDDEAEQEILA